MERKLIVPKPFPKVFDGSRIDHERLHYDEMGQMDTRQHVKPEWLVSGNYQRCEIHGTKDMVTITGHGSNYKLYRIVVWINNVKAYRSESLPYADDLQELAICFYQNCKE